MAKKPVVSLIKVNLARHQCVTQTARLSYPNLFIAKSFQDNPREPKTFDATLIFDSLKEIKRPFKGKKNQTISVWEAIQNVKVDQWGPDESKWPKFKYEVIFDGNDEVDSDGEVRQGYEGKTYIRTKSGEDFPPRVKLANGSDATEADLYGGCYVQAQILVRPYMKPDPGVSLRLVAIKKISEGEKFGAGADLFEYEEDDDCSGSEEWE